MRFRIGDHVRARPAAVPHHTRLPGYARGALGTVVAFEGTHPLADASAQGLAAVSQPVYSVRFTAEELFRSGTHTVTVSLWEEYLT